MIVTLNSIVRRSRRLNAIRKWKGTEREGGGRDSEKRGNGKMFVEYHGNP